jgi:hypothetical protein
MRYAMKRGAITASLGAVALTAAALAAATPASAETVGPFPCNTADGSVAGSTEHEGQITYIPGMAMATCGTLGIRVNYSHVGGTSWTSWKYQDTDDGDKLYVKRDVGSPIKSQHSATRGDLLFTSRNG